jgi:hypothetical protein
MEPQLRFLSWDDRKHLFALEEDSQGWTIKSYKNGYYHLKNKLKDFFGRHVPGIPGGFDGMEEEVMQMALKLGADYHKATKDAREEFCVGFIDDFILPRYPVLPWGDFLEDRKELRKYGSDAGSQMMHQIVRDINIMPDVFGLPEGYKYRDVCFSNGYSSFFAGKKEFELYLKEGLEPQLTLRRGLVKPALIIGTEENYIVTIKPFTGKKFTEARRETIFQTLNRTLALAGHYMQHNFPEQECTFVGIAYAKFEDQQGEYDCRHYKFDSERRELTEILNSGW